MQKQNVGGITMAHRREPLVPATRMTAAANLTVLRTKAAHKTWNLTPEQARAAMRVADQLERIVYDHVRKRR